MVKLRAKKKMDIGHIKAIITLKEKESRPDLIALLKNIDRFDLSKGESYNLKKYLEYLNLIRNGRLTSLGDKAIESGYIMMPESGLYELFYVNDRVIGSYIIHYLRIKPGKDITENAIEFLEFGLYDEQIFSSWKQQGIEFHIRFERQNNRIPMVVKKNYVNATFDLICDSEKETSISVESKEIECKYLDESYSKFRISENLPLLIEDWDKSLNAQLISYEKACEEAKSSPLILSKCKKRVSISGISLKYTWGIDEGSYNVVIEDMDVLPASKMDAEKWLYSLIVLELKKCNYYFTRLFLKEKEQEILDKVPFRRKYSTLFISEDALLKTLRKDPENENIAINIKIAEDLYPSEFITTSQEA